MARLILVGLPGCGKSTAGKQLARRLGLTFNDADLVIEQRVGCSISEYFEREGENAFRDVEESVLRELVQITSSVLATGGGAVLRLQNRLRLRQLGHVIYLHATPEELFRRLRHDTGRPLLQVDDLLTRLHTLHDERDLLYRETAHLVVETGQSSVRRLVNKIQAQLELTGIIPVPP